MRDNTHPRARRFLDDVPMGTLVVAAVGVTAVAGIAAAGLCLADLASAAHRAHALYGDQQVPSGYARDRVVVIATLVVGVLVGLGLARRAVRRTTGVARQLTAVAQALRAGDLTVRSQITGRDQVGRAAAALDGAADVLQATVENLVNSAEVVATSAEELSAVTSEIAGEAVRSSSRAEVVAAGSLQVGANIQNLATAAEQLSTSIREIAGNASSAARTAEEAGGRVRDDQSTVTKLGESSTRITTVVNLISSIAEQTNLLALNATIEAARAGEAGKGFAVVANEVKELASQTGRATTEICEQVETIQNDVAAAVEAIGRIVATVTDINQLQTAIAGAVEQQTTTTADISRSVQEAAAGSTYVSTTITEVADAATGTSSGVAQAQSATSELAVMAGQLRQLTMAFRY